MSTSTLNVRDIVSNCLGKSGNLSMLKDVLGVYATDNPQTRSMKDRLNLIQNSPFVRVALVTIQGANPNIQQDLDNANLVHQNECDTWVYCQGSITANRPDLLRITQTDCLTTFVHLVSDDEDELFDLGRGMGANIVCYYIIGASSGAAGCSANPLGRRGFWVSLPSNGSPYTFAHELTHVVGFNGHRGGDSNNLMFIPTSRITNLPPDLTDNQCRSIGNDRDMESCS